MQELHSNKIQTVACVVIYVDMFVWIYVAMFVCMSDLNSGILWPILQTFLLGISVGSRGLKIFLINLVNFYSESLDIQAKLGFKAST